MKQIKLLFLCVIISVSFVAHSNAETTVEDLEEQIEMLAEEIEAMKSGGSGGEDGEGKTTLGGYAELHFNDYDYDKTGKTDVMDFHRFTIFINHQFNDWIKFSSELEVEHGYIADTNTDTDTVGGSTPPEDTTNGEVEAEQAYIDLMFSRPIGFRAGVMVLPVGIISETHEPPTFYGVERPDVDKVVIPTSWVEGGVGVYGELAQGLSYKLLYTSSLDASNFRTKDGIRKGRGKVAAAAGEDMAISARLEYTGILGLKAGLSYVNADTAQNDKALDTDVNVEIFEGDIQYSIGNLDLRGLYAEVSINDADLLNAQYGNSVSDKISGMYVEAAYRVLGHFLPNTDQELAFFVRYSEYNLQDEVDVAIIPSGKYDIEVTTYGIDYKPHPNVVLKVDYQDRETNDKSVEGVDQWNLGVGVMF